MLTLIAAIFARYQPPTLADLSARREQLAAARNTIRRRHGAVKETDKRLKSVTTEMLRREIGR